MNMYLSVILLTIPVGLFIGVISTLAKAITYRQLLKREYDVTQSLRYSWIAYYIGGIVSSILVISIGCIIAYIS